MVKITRLPSGSYRARVHLGGGKYKSITGKDKKDVQLKAAQLEAEIEAKSNTDDPYSDMTIADALGGYIDSRSNVSSPKTIAEYRQMAKNYFLPITNVSLSDLKEQQVQTLVNTFSASHSPKTTRNMYSLLHSTIQMYRPDCILHIKLPQKEKTNIKIPTENEITSLLHYARDTDFELPLMLGALCGMCMSEIIGLKWTAVDIEARMITIDAAIVLDSDNKPVLKKPKSNAGFRKIKMLPQVADAFSRHINDGEFVVPLSASSIKKRYEKALTATGCQHYTFHELRHYAASVMIMLGIPVKYIADYLGHETEDMVNRVYGHIMADKKDEIFARLETYYTGIFEKSVTKSVTDK